MGRRHRVVASVRRRRWLSYQAETPSGGTIVLLAIGMFLVVSGAAVVQDRLRRAAHARAERHDHEHGPQCGHRARRAR